jgi:elongation factor P hydroxylase
MDDQNITQIFADCFQAEYATQLTGGATEPEYVPSRSADGMNQLFYRENFVASALHETAHWCIAGPERRLHRDFGYSYLPPPRTARQQADFFAAELKVQTLEMIFDAAAGLDFVPSADHLGVDLYDFRQQLEAHQKAVETWMMTSCDKRARTFAQSLMQYRQLRSRVVG